MLELTECVEEAGIAIERLTDVVCAEDDIDEVDELEAAHLQFAGLVRARREGSA
jgi:hypothetical protein